MSILGSTTKSFAQTDREMLLEISKQVAEISKQQAELSKQQAVTATKVDNLEKRFDASDKRMDMLFSLMIGSSSILFAGIFGLIGVIFWDRKTTAQPFEAKTDKLKAEIDLLKERELKHEEKTENNFKKLAQLDPKIFFIKKQANEKIIFNSYFELFNAVIRPNR